MPTLPYASAGMASSEAFAARNTMELFSGNTPHPVTEDFIVPAATPLPAFSVVGLTAGKLALASDTVVPIGITTAEVLSDAAEQSVAIYRAGCFNPAALNWGAAFDTDVKKAGAFRDAPTPTNILIRKFL